MATALGSALRKVVAAMPPRPRPRLAQRLARRVALFATERRPPAAAATLEEALLRSRVVEIGYEDRDGRVSPRASSRRRWWGPRRPGTSSPTAGCGTTASSLDRVSTARSPARRAPSAVPPRDPYPGPVRWLSLSE